MSTRTLGCRITEGFKCAIWRRRRLKGWHYNVGIDEWTIMEHRSKNTDTGQQKYSEKKPVTAPLCVTKEPETSWHRTRASVVTGRGLTAWATDHYFASKGGSRALSKVCAYTRRHKPQDGELELQISGYTLTWINEDFWRQSRVQLSAGVTNACIWRHQERDVTSLTWSGSTPCRLSTSRKRRKRNKH